MFSEELWERMLDRFGHKPKPEAVPQPLQNLDPTRPTGTIVGGFVETLRQTYTCNGVPVRKPAPVAQPVAEPKKGIPMNLKSLITGIASAAHTFVGYIGKALGVVGKYEPQIADVLSASMKYVEPLAVDIVSAEYGAGAGAAADTAIKELLLDTTSLKSLIYDWQNSPGIAAKIGALASDFSSAIALGHIKNPDSIAKANRIVAELSAAAAAATAAVAPAGA